jgi:hypothetical protein
MKHLSVSLSISAISLAILSGCAMQSVGSGAITYGCRAKKDVAS